jgi:hypothetical protein
VVEQAQVDSNIIAHTGDSSLEPRQLLRATDYCAIDLGPIRQRANTVARLDLDFKRHVLAVSVDSGEVERRGRAIVAEDDLVSELPLRLKPER